MILLENQRENYEKDYTVLKYLEIKRILEYLRTKKIVLDYFENKKNCPGINGNNCPSIY